MNPPAEIQSTKTPLAQINLALQSTFRKRNESLVLQNTHLLQSLKGGCQYRECYYTITNGPGTHTGNHSSGNA